MSASQSTPPPDNTTISGTTAHPARAKPSPSKFPANLPPMSAANPKKEAPPPPKRAPLGEIRPQNPPIPSQSQPKKLGRRSSKPILDWFQRKLGGTVRTRRASDVARGRVSTDRGASNREKRRPGFPDNYRELSRVQSTPSRGRTSVDRDIRRLSQIAASSIPSRGAGVSPITNDAASSFDGSEGPGDISTYRSSYARDSMWSPTSNLEADEDASMRPFPPSSPPSPSPSRSSSSYLSNPRTFQSMAASTKPTTLLSVDLTGGMAHIAQAPPTPGIAPRIPAHMWSSRSEGGSISFSALPPSPSSSHSPSLPPAHTHLDSNHPVQAPQHTTHHPRNNPRPSSPPLDNASVLTLASSAFGIPGARIGVAGGANDGMSLSHLSQFGGSRLGGEDRSSHFILGDDLDAEGDRDVDASVRALRPRSSRRGSWESEASGWSARVGNGSTVAIGPGTPAAVRDKRFWSASVKTSPTSLGGNDNEEEDEEETDDDGDDESSLAEAPSNEEPPSERSTLALDVADQPPSPHGSLTPPPPSLPPVGYDAANDDTDVPRAAPVHMENPISPVSLSSHSIPNRPHSPKVVGTSSDKADG